MNHPTDTRDLLLNDAERILRSILSGRDTLGTYGDIKDWIRACDDYRAHQPRRRRGR